MVPSAEDIDIPGGKPGRNSDADKIGCVSDLLSGKQVCRICAEGTSVDVSEFSFQKSPLVILFPDGVEQLRIQYDARYLVRNGRKRADLAFRIGTGVSMLDHDYPDRRLPFEHRDSEKRVIPLFTGFGEIFVARVFLGVF